MFNKILIANRGEIACRIMRTAHRLGIQCVAVYSEADANALHVRLADEAHCIGPAPSNESYLRGDKIIAIAQQTGAQAIHPGYGFLAENAAFAEACQQANICFIGPPPAAIRAMGSKSAAKNIVAKAKVPLLPGYHEAAQDLATLQKAAEKIGYPVLLKAIAGGGGKGMRIINNTNEFAAALAGAKREALANFGDDTVLIEKYLTQPRHIEIQIFADTHGNYLHLFERDCSIQRRHQKIIEEAPAPGISATLREQMGETAIAAARAIQYVGAGTIEFLLAEDNKFYFMEMNTRLQVEHPVTEMITQQDLVEWQLKVAAGEPLPVTRKQLHIHGHAFEARIYAEDPDNDFLPSIGLLKFVKRPSDNEYVRLDTGVAQGDHISHYYDPMMAKLITWGDNREIALQHLEQALANYQIVGVTTNLALLTAITQSPSFKAGNLSTNFIAQHHAELFVKPPVTNTIFAIAAIYLLFDQQKKMRLHSQHSHDPYSPWHTTDGWRTNLTGQQTLRFTHDNAEITVVVHYQVGSYLVEFPQQKITVMAELESEHELSINLNGEQLKAIVYVDQTTIFVLVAGQRYQLNKINAVDFSHHHSNEDIKARLTAPMPGKVVALLVEAGARVEQGTGLAVVEAMKMEHTIHAPANGVVKEWYFKVGDLVDEGAELLAFEELEK